MYDNLEQRPAEELKSMAEYLKALIRNSVYPEMLDGYKKSLGKVQDALRKKKARGIG